MTSAAGTITDEGLVVMTKQLGNVDAPSPFGYIAVGTGSEIAAVTDTQLVAEKTENGFARAESTNSYVPDFTARFFHTFTSAANNEIVREIGLFNAMSGSTLGFRAVLASDKVVDEGETCDVIIDIVNGRA